MSKRKTSSNKDGGYGWVVMVSFFLLEFLVDGIRFSFGLYFVEYLEEFKRGKGVTAWAGSLMVATYNLAGPIFAIIVNKVGCRQACFIGSIVTTIGFLLSSFVPDVFYLYVTYIIQGFGFGLMFLSGTVAISYYFFKKRARAMGFGLCGSGVGMFVFTPLVRYAIDTYTWRGSMFIMAGFTLNGCVLAMLLRPIEGENVSMDFEDFDLELEVQSVRELATPEANINNIAHTPDCDQCNDDTSIHLSQEDHLSQKPSVCSCNGSVGSIDKTSEVAETTTAMNGMDSNNVIIRHSPLQDIDENKPVNGHLKMSPLSPLLTEVEVVHSNGNVFQPLSPLPKLPLTQDAARLSSSRGNIHGSHRSLRSLNMSILSQSMLGSNASFEYIFEKSKRTKTLSTLAVNKPSKDADNKTETKDVEANKFSNSWIEALFPKVLVVNRDFQLLMLASVLAGIPAFIPYSMLPDLAQLSGATATQSAWTMSAIGIGGTVSRLGGGWLSDIDCVHNLTLLSASFLGCGITAIIVAFFNSYAIVMTYSVMYGVFFGAVYIVQPIVLLEYLGEEYIAEMMGSLMFTYGVTQFIGSPVAGWLYDVTSSYTISFVVAGLLFTFSGVVNQCIMCTRYCRKDDDDQTNEPVDV